MIMVSKGEVLTCGARGCLERTRWKAGLLQKPRCWKHRLHSLGANPIRMVGK